MARTTSAPAPTAAIATAASSRRHGRVDHVMQNTEAEGMAGVGAVRKGPRRTSGHGSLRRRGGRWTPRPPLNRGCPQGMPSATDRASLKSGFRRILVPRSSGRAFGLLTLPVGQCCMSLPPRPRCRDPRANRILPSIRDTPAVREWKGPCHIQEAADEGSIIANLLWTILPPLDDVNYPVSSRRVLIRTDPWVAVRQQERSRARIGTPVRSK